MKKAKMVRKVVRYNMMGFDGYAIMNGEEVDKFYPVKIRKAETIGNCDTEEVSTEFFWYIRILQNHGVEVLFNL